MGSICFTEKPKEKISFRNMIVSHLTTLDIKCDTEIRKKKEKRLHEEAKLIGNLIKQNINEEKILSFEICHLQNRIGLLLDLKSKIHFIKSNLHYVETDIRKVIEDAQWKTNISFLFWVCNLYFEEEYIIFKSEFKKTNCFSQKELESFNNTQNIDANVVKMTFPPEEASITETINKFRIENGYHAI